ncbi:MAG: hypothetical protein Q7J16_12325 [Candidatus Cloacimonadales bacterium]|nr:hypothetical protein [Candidatus Cloacimonadales bacterium]
MKKFILFILPALIIFGCSSEGDIKIINRTDHYLYFNIEGTDYVLEGSENSNPSKSVSIDTGSQFLFWGDDETKVPMNLEGETFMMQDSDASGVPNGLFFTETILAVKPNETLKIYCDPTHAGVKLVNNSQVSVSGFSYYTDDSDSLVSLIEYPVISGDSIWSRLKATTSYDSIIYSFVIEYENGWYDSSYVNIDDLIVDEQLRIELQ